MPINVGLVEDHADIRQGLSFIIGSSDDFACSAYANAEDALEAFETARPDVVLMDINLPGMSGIECTRIIKEKYPQVNIMMCTSYEEDEKVFSALSAGASGYILKRAAADNLLDAIKELNEGGSPMSSMIARKVVASFRKTPADHSSTAEFQLTQRENEILDLLAQGLRNKEIADKLFVSVNTIRKHVYNIYEKLHVQSKIEALNKTGRGFSR
ncbi:MAG: response regulator [Flavobacteriales bacterium]